MTTGKGVGKLLRGISIIYTIKHATCRLIKKPRFFLSIFALTLHLCVFKMFLFIRLSISFVLFYMHRSIHPSVYSKGLRFLSQLFVFWAAVALEMVVGGGCDISMISKNYFHTNCNHALNKTYLVPLPPGCWDAMLLYPRIHKQNYTHNYTVPVSPSAFSFPHWARNNVELNVWYVQLCGSKSLSSHAGCQEVSRCCTKGDLRKSIAHRQQNMKARINPGFETQGRHQQKSKIRVSVTHKKDLSSEIKKLCGMLTLFHFSEEVTEDVTTINFLVSFADSYFNTWIHQFHFLSTYLNGGSHCWANGFLLVKQAKSSFTLMNVTCPYLTYNYLCRIHG